MTDPQQLDKGERHRWRIVAHQPWGLKVESTDLPGVYAVVDLLFMGIEGPINGPEDYPPVGEEVEAVVQGYMPNGQLRVSMRPEDLGSG
jgi:hypothetical protein